MGDYAERSDTNTPGSIFDVVFKRHNTMDAYRTNVFRREGKALQEKGETLLKEATEESERLGGRCGKERKGKARVTF